MSKVRLKCGIEGRFHVVQRCRDGNIKFESEFKNLLMDQGLNAVAGTAVDTLTGSCLLLTDNTPPVQNETAQDTDWGYRSASRSLSRTAGVEPLWETINRYVYSFAPASQSYNISSIAVGRYENTVNDRRLLSRALILDDLDQPTTLAVLEGDYVQVTYRLYFYPSTDDVTGTITLDGDIGGEYDYTIRLSGAGTLTGGLGHVGPGVASSGSFRTVGVTTGGPRVSQCYTGDIGPVDGTPSGDENSTRTDTSVDVHDYTQGSFSRQITWTRGLRSNPINIRSAVHQVGIFAYQTQFDPPIPKTTPSTLVLTYEVSWGRR